MSGVYLVDDHANVRDGLRSVLAAAGHVVVGEAADATQVLADLQRLAPAVLLDIQLGPHSGFALLTEVQRRKPGVRTIVLTMSAQPRPAPPRGRGAGSKPLARPLLEAALGPSRAT